MNLYLSLASNPPICFMTLSKVFPTWIEILWVCLCVIRFVLAETWEEDKEVGVVCLGSDCCTFWRKGFAFGMFEEVALLLGAGVVDKGLATAGVVFVFIYILVWKKK